jgi:RNA polymerase sigma-32 factor
MGKSIVLPAYKMLSADEEYALAVAWRDKGDLDARTALIKAHFPLAGKIAAKYGGGGVPRAWPTVRKYGSKETADEARNDGGQPANDIGQVALMGLIEATNRFDPTLGNRFSTYAQWWVRKEINDYIGSLKRLGANKDGSDALSLDARTDDGEGDTGAFVDMLTDGEGAGGEFYSVLSGPLPRPQEEILMRKQADEIHRHALAIALAELDDRERCIFTARWLDEPKTTLKLLAAEFGVSQKRIHVIAERAREKVRVAYDQTLALSQQVKMAA